MDQAPTLQTARLVLRQWRAADRAPFARLNADPRVMEHFPSTLSPPQSDMLIDRIVAQFAERGFSLWAVEVCGDAPFIGFVGLSAPAFVAHFTPCVEIGWRLAAESWGHGYASEAAAAALTFGFAQASLPEIVSFTVVGNHRSRRVMERLGMHHSVTDDFDHLNLPAGHPLRRHVLYRISASEWAARK